MYHDDDDDNDNCIVEIEKLDNGYEVSIRHAGQAAANKTSMYKSSMMDKPYEDPWHSYAFKTPAEVCAFLAKNLDKATPELSYDDAFEEATASRETNSD